MPNKQNVVQALLVVLPSVSMVEIIEESVQLRKVLFLKWTKNYFWIVSQTNVIQKFKYN